MSFNVRKIAVIGAGPSGLAAAKYLLAEKTFERIVLFEQRAVVGGIWNYTPDARSEETFEIPSTDPRRGLDRPVGWAIRGQGAAPNGTGKSKSPVFVSPIYERLETNIPRSLMRYSDHPFRDDAQLFPKHGTVLEYLDKYAEDVRELIQFRTQVVDVRPIPRSQCSGPIQGGVGDEQWKVRTLNLVDNHESEEVYDAVVVANGHYSVPFVPDVRGIREWNKAYPGAISHSKYYRTPDEFKGKKVVVVGSSASGLDIGAQIQSVCALPLLVSQKSTSYLTAGAPPDPSRVELPPISSFIVQDRALRFEDGHIEKNIDAVLYCTGYLYSLPFLSSLDPPLISDGSHVQHTYQHLLYSPRPTLSFLALPQRIIPFPVAEVQSAVLARLYTNRISLPSYETMCEWERSVIAGQGDGGDFHALQFPKDANYINELHDWAMQASMEGGKAPPRWGEWEYWARERFPAIRRAFVRRGEERAKITRLEEVGFDFAAWKEGIRKEGEVL